MWEGPAGCGRENNFGFREPEHGNPIIFGLTSRTLEFRQWLAEV